MKTLLIVLCSVFLISIYAGVTTLTASTAYAQECAADECSGGCTAAGQCSGGRICEESTENRIVPPNYSSLVPVRVIKPTGGACGGGVGQTTLGGVNVPWAVSRYNPRGENTSESIGIINFASRLLRVLTIICGVWFMLNMIYAGYMFITSSGDAAVFGKFKDSLFYSIIGLFVIAAAYMIAGLVGAVFFGDAGFIIRPTLFPAS